MNASLVTRFAPSPTGAPHLGNLRAAALNFLLARHSGGKFLLRLEDTDRERSTFASEAAILSALDWLGITPDEPVLHQSLRLQRYRAAVETLMAKDMAYPCFCTEEELEKEREYATRQGLPPRYSGRCAHLDAREKTERLARGDAHVIRFRLPERGEVHFRDRLKGEMTIPVSAFGDFVLLRSTGWPSYNLAVVVDDAEMGVNFVLRGEDHLTNTARQILLYEALGKTPPVFAHHGLLVDATGAKLSKRNGAPGQEDCRRIGLEPLAVVHYLASLGGALSTKKLFPSLEEMAKAFNPSALGRGNAVLRPDELRHLSARYFRMRTTQELVNTLSATLPESDGWHTLDGCHQMALADALRENAASVQDLCALTRYFTQEPAYSLRTLRELAQQRDLLDAMSAALSTAPETLDKDAASRLLHDISETTGRRGRDLYHPIRMALTGSPSGPELTAVLTLLPTQTLRLRVQDVLEIFSATKE